MFDFLFKYPAAVFSKGRFTLLGSAPWWGFVLATLAAAGLLGWIAWRRHSSVPASMTRARLAVIWALQSLLASLLLLLLWRPALSIATLQPRQNIVAVVVDDSRSMAIAENGGTRRDQAAKLLDGSLLNALAGRFQVRLYRMGAALQRFEKPDQLKASEPATHIADALKQVVAEAATLPVGAVVLVSDGADNSGGIDLETIGEIRRQRIPIHTIGVGRERFSKDVEISDVQLPPRAIAGSRIAAQVTLRQSGYSNTQAHVTARDGDKVLASKLVALKSGAQQTETLIFNAGAAGARNVRVSVDTLAGEENANNNSVTRVVSVEAKKTRVLYVEGEPRWEFKFIRRAFDDDESVKPVTILRTTQNKIYRQGIDTPKELEEGFPAKVEEVFAYQAIVIGSVEAAYFTPAQLDLIRQFVDRRGGGLLFLAGRYGLSEGGWQRSSVADLLPVTLPDRKGTFVRDPANVELTAAGRESLICRIEEDVQKNEERWRKLPYIANFQDPGTPKPGAVVLAEYLPTSRGRFPLLVTENYGRGRTAVFASAGSWRWQMLQPVADRSHEMFWQQVFRWLADSPGRVIASTPRQVLEDESRVPLRAEVRDTTYLPAPDAHVEAHIQGPEGIAATVELQPDPLAPGVYTGEWRAEKPGGYVAEIVAKRGDQPLTAGQAAAQNTGKSEPSAAAHGESQVAVREIGRDAVMFRREDGVAENFHAEQNRELLEKLSSQTGGRYYKPDEWKKLGEEIAYSEAGINVREIRELWDMPIVFLLAIAIRAAEWLLRRRWGVV